MQIKLAIFVVDDTTHTPWGKCSVKASVLGVGEKMISNVWHVPTIKKNLLCLFILTRMNSLNYTKKGYNRATTIQKLETFILLSDVKKNRGNWNPQMIDVFENFYKKRTFLSRLYFDIWEEKKDIFTFLELD